MVEQFSRGEIGYDFAIRTPCTPARWDEFDAEMTMAWEVSYTGAQTLSYIFVLHIFLWLVLKIPFAALNRSKYCHTCGHIFWSSCTIYSIIALATFEILLANGL